MVPEKVSTKRILVSLIKSIDAYNSLLESHHKRTTAIAYQLGSEYGLDSRALSKLVVASSIHDIGAIYATERDQLISMDVDNSEPHEINGARILSGIAPFDCIRPIIRRHHVHYNDVINGTLASALVPEECYFLHLADRIDIYSLHYAGEDNARTLVMSGIKPKFGTVFHPDLESAFDRVAQNVQFWLNADETLYHELLLAAIDDDRCDMGAADLESLARLFGRIVDYKSHWTFAHSQTVGLLASRIGELMGMDSQRCFKLKMAGYLHDIGKIAVPAEVLEKPGPLDPVERNAMQRHALFSSIILSDRDGLSDIARWASSHHERRDRTGYPLKMSADRFEPEMDIIAYSDVFAALLESRPYRDAFTDGEAMEILRSMAPLKLSREVFEVIASHFGELSSIARETRDSQEEINTEGGYQEETYRYRG